ncbi:hypothetical protein KC675_04035 [Candidatus Dojkabacteria bacterium]|jgi:mRNA-degrading endonuclease HigB of HigAB toxin-antitoxin module|uniref:Uncharacterized protein n=1 Tax=Candidatus Dojkabacteria bacterium TaxID=2099670 RepID=A0A955I790_9BACT|nr:hypothetical protein [Candidatus Dojkabacteria bacterium]
MDDFLQKIQNIKDQKLAELNKSITEIQNRELEPIRREELSLKNIVKQKIEQNEDLKVSRAKFLEKSSKMGIQSAAKKDLIEKFVDDYLNNLFKDKSRLKDLLAKNIEKIKDEKGTLNIDENSYNLVKSVIKDSWDIKIDNHLKGFIFESQAVSVELTEAILRKEIYDNNKTALNQILFE